MKVSEVLRIFEKAIVDLKAMPQDLECVVVDCPDGCYTGDLECAPYCIKVDKESMEHNEIVVLCINHK